jgi:hypothetical protein
VAGWLLIQSLLQECIQHPDTLLEIAERTNHHIDGNLIAYFLRHFDSGPQVE